MPDSERVPFSAQTHSEVVPEDVSAGEPVACLLDHATEMERVNAKLFEELDSIDASVPTTLIATDSSEGNGQIWRTKDQFGFKVANKSYTFPSGENVPLIIADYRVFMAPIVSYDLDEVPIYDNGPIYVTLAPAGGKIGGYDVDKLASLIVGGSSFWSYEAWWVSYPVVSYMHPNGSEVPLYGGLSFRGYRSSSSYMNPVSDAAGYMILPKSSDGSFKFCGRARSGPWELTKIWFKGMMHVYGFLYERNLSN
jgi:hypothetical protein